MTDKWMCPTHHKPLHTIPDYKGALIHGKPSECSDIFTVIDGHLCRCQANQCIDTVTGEIRIPKEVARGG